MFLYIGKSKSKDFPKIDHFRYIKIQSKTKRHHLEALGNKLIQILIFIPQILEMMSFV